ncbi:MAG: hypothetical protein ACREDO_10155 [Methyloceanibacter sp.]
MKRYAEAAAESKAAVDAAAANGGLRVSELALWDFGTGDDERFTAAKQAFQSFIEIGSSNTRRRRSPPASWP